MITIQQELAQLQAEFEALMAAWNRLSNRERRREWRGYLDAVDHGDDGWHRFGRLLVNAYCEGWNALEGVAADSDGQLGPAVPLVA